MKKKHFLLWVCSATILVACQKEPDLTDPDTPTTANPASPASCKPVKAYLYDDANPNLITDSVRYEYANDQLTKIYANTDAYITFEYAAGKVSKRSFYTVGLPQPDDYDLFSYNNDGTLARIERFDSSFTGFAKYDSLAFAYTGGKLGSVREYWYNGTTAGLHGEYLYTWSGNNISTQVYNDYGSGPLTSTTTTQFTYDTQPNYFRKQSTQFLQTDPFFLESDVDYYTLFLSENNVLKSEEPSVPGSASNWTYAADANGNLNDLKRQGNRLLRYEHQCR